MKLGHLMRDLEIPGVPLHDRPAAGACAGRVDDEVEALTGSADPEVAVARPDGTLDTFRPRAVYCPECGGDQQHLASCSESPR